ncbi:MAG: SurA N-terminal domain-containing protein [Terriglobales bacterium]
MKTVCKLLLFAAAFTGSVAAQTGLVASHSPSKSVAPPASSAADLQKQVVARVNGVGITQRDLQEQMQRLFPYYSMHGGNVPEKYQSEIRDKALQQLIDDELMYEAAKQQGITVSAATMASVLKQARSRFPTSAAYGEYAKAQYGSVQDFERRIRRAVLIAKYQDREIAEKSKFSDAKLREIYSQNKKAFVRPESVWLQTISVSVPNNPSPKQREMAEARIAEALPKAKAARNHDEFGLLAEKYSEDDYRVVLGDHKWVHLVGLPEPLAKAAAEMKPGSVSDVVKTPNALVILRVNEIRQQKQMEFAEIAPSLRKQLEDSARKDRWTQLRDQLRKKAKVEVL